MTLANVSRWIAHACLAALAVGCTWPSQPDDNGGDFGHFDGPVRAEWLLDGRKMVLLNEVVFYDRSGFKWTAPSNATIDGASIPEVFWSFVAGPYEGKHRDASVIHDYECCVKEHEWRKVHRMYFDAMMARGEEPGRARLMYWAVYRFGPRWPEPAPVVGFTEDDVARAAEYFSTTPDLTLQDIEDLEVADLRARVPVPSAAVMARHALQPGISVIPVDRRAPCFGGE